MWEDPIVAEVHRIREQLAAQFNFDIQAMFADMRTRQSTLGPRLVSLANPGELTGEPDRSGEEFAANQGTEDYLAKFSDRPCSSRGGAEA